MSAGYLLFLASGRMFIFLIRKFFKDTNIKIPFLDKLLSCPLCAGVWVYTILSWLMGYYVFDDFIPYTPILSQVVAGCFSAVLMYYLETGWKAINEVVIV